MRGGGSGDVAHVRARAQSESDKRSLSGEEEEFRIERRQASCDDIYCCEHATIRQLNGVCSKTTITNSNSNNNNNNFITCNKHLSCNGKSATSDVITRLKLNNDSPFLKFNAQSFCNGRKKELSQFEDTDLPLHETHNSFECKTEESLQTVKQNGQRRIANGHCVLEEEKKQEQEEIDKTQHHLESSHVKLSPWQRLRQSLRILPQQQDTTSQARKNVVTSLRRPEELSDSFVHVSSWFEDYDTRACSQTEVIRLPPRR